MDTNGDKCVSESELNATSPPPGLVFETVASMVSNDCCPGEMSGADYVALMQQMHPIVTVSPRSTRRSTRSTRRSTPSQIQDSCMFAEDGLSYQVVAMANLAWMSTSASNPPMPIHTGWSGEGDTEGRDEEKRQEG